MRVKLKRVLSFVSAVVICGVSCVTAWFSVPVSAASGVGWLEWLEFQTLLQGIGVSGNNSDFADSVDTWIDNIGGPEMPREDYDGKWMTNYEYYNRLGWDSIIDWFDGLFSGDNAYKDVPDVNTWVPDDFTYDGLETYDGFFKFSKALSYTTRTYADSSFALASQVGMRFTPSDSVPYVILVSVSDDSVDPPYQVYQLIYSNYFHKYMSSSFSSNYMYLGTAGAAWSFTSLSVSRFTEPFKYYDAPCWSASDMQGFFSAVGVDSSKRFDTVDDAVNYINKQSSIDWKPGQTGSGSFVGPVYTYPAAQDLYKSTGTAAGIRLDVQTQDGVPDIQAALDGAGVKTVDDLVAGVAAGTVPMSKVFTDAKVTPYVVADTSTGAVVTDLGVSATAAGVKAVGLTQELAVPKDLTNAVAYPIKGKTWDPDMAKYKLPLFQFFPFCLPWDIYEVLTLFDAEPVAPKFTIPVGQFFTRFSGSVDTSKAADQKAVVDLGADSWQSTFKVIRALECAAIIIGLCLTAVLLIHGGR